MARVAAMTEATDVGGIDVVATAGAIAANSYFQSAFLRIANSQNGDRIRNYVTEGPLTFAAQATEGTEPTEQTYTPINNEVTAAVNVCDVVITQEALKDGRTSGKSIQEQVISSGTQAYVKFVDSQGAALYTAASSTAPDHQIGSATTSISGPLIDEGIELLLTKGLKTPYALVIRTSILPQLMQIPGMRDYAVLGANGPGGIRDLMMANDALVVSGYGGVLDIYHSPQIVSSTGVRNLMVAVGNQPEHRSIVNPWTPVETDRGVSSQKLLVDPFWNSAARSLDMNLTTIEAWSLRDSASAGASEYIVELKTQ